MDSHIVGMGMTIKTLIIYLREKKLYGIGLCLISYGYLIIKKSNISIGLFLNKHKKTPKTFVSGVLNFSRFLDSLE